MSDSIRDAFEDGAASLADELQGELENATRHVKDGFAKATESLEEGADVLKGGMRRTREEMKRAGRRASHAVDDASEYFREHGPRGVLRDVEALIREHPGKALLTVAAIGILIGRGLKQRR